MTQANGTKSITQPTGRETTSNGKKSLVHHVSSIADVFGEDRGLLKFLLTLSDEELAGVQKFAQGYIEGLFPIDVFIEQPSQISL